MNDLLQRYLDGEIPFDALPEDLAEVARRWDERLAGSRLRYPRTMPAGLEARIVRAVEAKPAGPLWRRALEWLLRPRPVAVSPLVGMMGAAALAVMLLGPWGGDAPDEAVLVGDDGDAYVEFVLQAPQASSVAVAGDFTTWAPQIELQDPDGDGVWSGRVRVRPGVHKYMFVVDGNRWVTDPSAVRHVDDGFGNRNAILVVSEGSRS